MTMRNANAALVLLLILSTLPTASTANPEGDPDDIPWLISFADLKAVFDADEGNVRLVALLSPSCAYCVKGFRYMRKILSEVDDPRLKMYVIWEPMLSGDTESIANRVARRAKDQRLSYQAWDNERVTGHAWQRVMEHPGVAWDVYYLYAGEARWAEEGPSTPAYWQHQGQGGRENWLDYDKLKAAVLEQLAALGA